MLRNRLKFDQWQNEMMGILSNEKNNEFQKLPLGVAS